MLLAFVPPLIIYFYFQRETRGLEITINNETPVIELNKKYSQDIEVFYKNNKINSLEVLEVSVKNTGNQPIDAGHFSVPLTFAFGGPSQIPFSSIKSHPKSLKPILEQIADSVYQLKPLLLNQGDKFDFLAFIIDSKFKEQPLRVNARIHGITDTVIVKASSDESPIKQWIEIVGVILGVLTSLIALLSVTKRFKDITFKLTPSGQIEVKLSEISEKKEIQSLAKRLKIEDHDTKSNLLLIRIKLEEQLREVASNLDLPEKKRLVSPTHLSKYLEEQKIISSNSGNKIREILRIINRELHISESYLDTGEYKDLQVQSLRYLDELISLNDSTLVK